MAKDNNNNKYQQARENVKSMSNEKLQQYRDRLEWLEQEWVKIGDQDKYSQETAIEAIQAFQDEFQERWLGNIDKDMEEMQNQSQNGEEGTNKESQSDISNQNQTNTNEAKQTSVRDTDKQESGQTQQTGEWQDQDEGDITGQAGIGIPNQDEDVVSPEEEEIIQSKLQENREKIGSMTEQEWNKRVEQIRNQYDTGEAEDVIDIAQSYRDQEQRARELGDMSAEEIYQLDQDDELTSEDKNLLQERNSELYNNYKQYKETKWALDNADKMLNDKDQEDKKDKKTTKDTEQTAIAQQYEKLRKLVEEKNKKLNENDEITQLNDSLSNKQEELKQINQDLQEMEQKIKKNNPWASGAMVRAMAADRQSSLLSEKRTLQNSIQSTRQKLQNRTQNIKDTYNSQIKQEKLRLEQKQQVYERKFQLMQFQQNQQYKQKQQQLSSAQLQLKMNQFQAEQEQERNALQRYKNKQIIKAKIDNAFSQNIKDTQILKDENGKPTKLLNMQTGDTIAKFDESKTGDGSIDDQIDNGKVHFEYNTETGDIKPSKSYVQVRNTDSNGKDSIWYFYSVGQKGFIEDMDIKRDEQNINQTTNNPGNITADWLPNSKAKKEYGKKIGAIWTYKNEQNGREYFVFEDPASGFKTLKEDIQTKKTGETQTDITPQSSLKIFLDTYVWHDINKSPGYRDAVLQQVFGTSNKKNLDTAVWTLKTGPLARWIAKAEGYEEVNDLRVPLNPTMSDTQTPESIQKPEGFDKRYDVSSSDKAVILSDDFAKQYNNLNDTYQTFVEQQLSGDSAFKDFSVNDPQGKKAKVALIEWANAYGQHIRDKYNNEGLAKIYESASNLEDPSNSLVKKINTVNRLNGFINEASNVTQSLAQESDDDLFGFLEKKVNSMQFWKTNAQKLGITDNAAAIFGKTVEQRLSDQDLKRYKKIMPKATNTEQANKFLSNFIKTMSLEVMLQQMEQEADTSYMRNKADTYEKYQSMYMDSLTQLEQARCAAENNSEQCTNNIVNALEDKTFMEKYGYRS